MSFVFFEKICIYDRERIVWIEGGKRDKICEKGVVSTSGAGDLRPARRRGNPRP